MQFEYCDLGIIDFSQAYLVQKNTLREIREKKTPNKLILCEHKPVITRGRTSLYSDNILASSKLLEENKISIVDTDRGGDVTYHGPGQLIVYPLIDLNTYKKDIRIFLRVIENIIIDFLKEFSIKASRKDGFTGVWFSDEKIASIGIAIRHWITYHGLAVNINTNLDHFKFIKPCGLNCNMTSLKKILNKTIDINECKHIIINKFKTNFN